MIVARHHQHAALRRRTIGIAVMQRIARAVDPRPLAIPHGKDALDPRIGVQRGLLRAQHGGCAQILVHRRQEGDVILRQPLLRPPQLLIHRAEGGTAIARDIAGGLQPRRPVAARLIQQDPHQCLRSGQKDPAGCGVIAVFQCVAVRGRLIQHACLPCPSGQDKRESLVNLV